MGATQLTSLLQDLQSYLVPRSNSSPARASNAQPSAQKAASTDTADTSTPAATDFTAVGYRSEYQRIAMTLQYQQMAARAQGDEEAGAASQQFEFSFTMEVRSEELAAFSQRTRTAAEGMTESERTEFLAATRSLSARFQMSATLSGEALEDYAGAAEEFASSGDANLDSFMRIVRKMFAKDDDVLAEGLKLLRHFMQGAQDVNRRMEKLANDLSQLGVAAPPEQGAQTMQVQVQLEFTYEEGMIIVQRAEVQQADPIVLDLDSDGVELTDHTSGADFDITGSGAAARTAFVNGGDAFLAFDRNDNGRIDDGRELFGDQHGAANGYEELAKLDANGDSLIDDQDEGFGRLLLFRDNGNGITEADETMTLSQAGIAALYLRYRNIDMAAAGGNRLAQASLYRRNDGTHGLAADALLNYTV